MSFIEAIKSVFLKVTMQFIGGFLIVLIAGLPVIFYERVGSFTLKIDFWTVFLIAIVTFFVNTLALLAKENVKREHYAYMRKVELTSLMAYALSVLTIGTEVFTNPANYKMPALIVLSVLLVLRTISCFEQTKKANDSNQTTGPNTEVAVLMVNVVTFALMIIFLLLAFLHVQG